MDIAWNAETVPMTTPGLEPAFRYFIDDTSDAEDKPNDAGPSYATALRSLYDLGRNRDQYADGELTTKISKKPQYIVPVHSLMDHQAFGVAYMKLLRSTGYRGCFLADGPGAGKTLQLLALLEEYSDSNRPHLLVIPAGLFPKWKKDVERFLREDRQKHILFYQYSKGTALAETGLRKFKIIITAYTSLSAELDRFENFRRAVERKSRSRKESELDASEVAATPHVRQKRKEIEAETKENQTLEKRSVRSGWPLLELKYDVLAMDEAHMAKNSEGTYFQSLMRVRCKFVVAATGTRLQNTYAEILSLCRLIRLEPLNDIELFESVSSSRGSSQYPADHENTVLCQWCLLRATERKQGKIPEP
jgi:SNF2 family DNA or RNA helicase